MLPSEIRAAAPLYFNDYAVRRFLAAFSTCTPPRRRAMMCLYLKHQAFRSRQSRHGWKAIQKLFALIKNPKYVKMRLPKNGRPSKLNNTANAGRIVRGRNGRKILPAFLLTVFVAALATAAIPQKKKERRNHFGADQEKEVLKKPSGRYGRKIVKGEASSRPVCRSQSAAPVIRGIAHSPIRRRADHRTPAEPSAAEFSGLVSAVAHTSRGQRPPYRSVLTWHK